METKIFDLIKEYADDHKGNYLLGNQCVLNVKHYSDLKKIVLHFNMDGCRKLNVALSFEGKYLQITVDECCLTGFELKDCIQLFSDWHIMVSVLHPKFIDLYFPENSN